MPIWQKPLYQIKAKSGKNITVDVTLSVNPALGPNQAITEAIDFFKRKDVKRVLDFGAGALRHTLPLLKEGFQVCAVDFEEQFVDSSAKKVCRANREIAESYPNFSALVYPRDFVQDARVFNAALLCYTFQGMPIRSECEKVLKLIYKKLTTRSYVLWMSRWGDSKNLPDDQRALHGHYKYDNLTSGYHSFYAEFKTEAIHTMMASVGWRKEFRYLKSLGQGGRDQLFLYSKREGETFA